MSRDLRIAPKLSGCAISWTRRGPASSWAPMVDLCGQYTARAVLPAREPGGGRADAPQRILARAPSKRHPRDLSASRESHAIHDCDFITICRRAASYRSDSELAPARRRTRRSPRPSRTSMLFSRAAVCWTSRSTPLGDEQHRCLALKSRRHRSRRPGPGHAFRMAATWSRAWVPPRRSSRRMQRSRRS